MISVTYTLLLNKQNALTGCYGESITCYQPLILQVFIVPSPKLLGIHKQFVLWISGFRATLAFQSSEPQNICDS